MWMFDLIWQAWYRCHHNTYPSSHHVQKPTAKHTNCPATLNVTVKTVADRCRWVRQCVYIIVYSRRDWRQIHLKSYHTLLLVRSCTKYGHVNAKPKSRIYTLLITAVWIVCIWVCWPSRTVMIIDRFLTTYQITYQTRPPQGKLAQPQESHRLK